MKKQLFRLLTAAALVAVALAFAAPARAEEKAAKEKPAAAAEKPAKPKVHQCTGTIESMDETSITLKNIRGETKTLKLTAETKVKKSDNKPGAITDWKVGDKVLVKYTEDGTVKSIGPVPPKKEGKPKKEGAEK